MFKLCTYFLLILTIYSCNKLDSQRNKPKAEHNIHNDLTFFINNNRDTIFTNRPLNLKGTSITLTKETSYKLLLSDKLGEYSKEKFDFNYNSKIITPFKSILNKTINEIEIKGDVIFVRPPSLSDKVTPVYRDNSTLDIQCIGIDQGLSSSYVVNCFEDSRNNIWFGTYGGGVSRYDGTKFSHYTEENGLQNDYVWSIYEDSKNNLWFGYYFGGLTKYDGLKFTHFNEGNGFFDNTVWKIIEDNNGNMWFGTQKGVVKYDGRKFTHYTENNGLCGNNVVALEVDKHNNLWVGTKANGLSVFDGNSFYNYTINEGLPSDKIMSIYKDFQNNIWVGTVGGGACKFHDKEHITIYNKKNGLIDDNISSITGDNNRVWIATLSGGLSTFDGLNFNSVSNKDGLPSNRIRHIMIDSKHNIWGGTEGVGVFNYKPKSFIHFDKSNGLSNNKIYSIYEDSKGKIWFGTFGNGIICLNDNIFIDLTKNIKDLANLNVISIFEDLNGNMWFGTFDNGVFKYDGIKFEQFSLKNGLPSNMIWAINQDKNGNMWFGSEGSGLIKFNGKEYKKYSLSEGFSSNIVWDISKDHLGNLWIATNEGGVCKYDGASFSFLGSNNGLRSNIVWTVKEDSRNNMWFATHEGLIKYDGKSMQHFTEKEGMSNNVVWSIQEDSKGNIWTTTEKGLNCIVYDKSLVSKIDTSELIDGNKAYIQHYNKIDGLKAVDFYANSAIIDSNNDAWWGSSSSLVKLDLDSYMFNTYVPKVQLQTIEINQKSFEFNRFNDTSYIDNSSELLLETNSYPIDCANFFNYPKKITLPFSSNYLTFKFVAPNIGSSHETKYSFMMLGLDNTWSISTNETKAEYRSIPPGKYTFLIRAIDVKSKKWSKTFRYDIVILPPWWKTYWAISFYFSVIIFSVFLGFRTYSSRMKRRQIELEKIVKERTMWIVSQKNQVEQQKMELINAYRELENERNKLELKTLLNQINPHFVFNTLNSIQQFIISNNTKSSLDYFNRFGKLIRSCLEHSEMKFVTIMDEIKVIENYLSLENLRYNESIQLLINEGGIDVFNVKIPPMFIQPIIENSIIHGFGNKTGDKIIQLTFLEFEEYILCSIEDNGTGRVLNEKDKRTNSGLKITKRRLNSIWHYNLKNSNIKIIDLKDEKGNAEGTIVSINLPKDF